jgi:hypothetical protein
MKQTYQNIDHVIIEDEPPSVVFNNGIQSSDGLIYCFLDYYSNFCQDNVIERVVNILTMCQELGGIYTDNFLNNYRQYYPSYSHLSLQEATINTPFFCRKETNIQFDITDSSLYYDKAIKALGKNVILHHIPEALFTINDIVN